MQNCTKMNTNLYTGHLKANEYATSTINSNVRMLTVFLNWLKQEHIQAEEVRYTDILAYIKHHQRKNASQQTIQNYLNAVRLYYDCLLEHTKITHHPLVKVKQGNQQKKAVPCAGTAGTKRTLQQLPD